MKRGGHSLHLSRDRGRPLFRVRLFRFVIYRCLLMPTNNMAFYVKSPEILLAFQ